MSSIQEKRERLRQIILRDAYTKGKFILSSGKESDYYIDARLVTLNAEGVSLIAEIMLDMIKKDNIQAIGGPTLGADPMIGALGMLSFQQGKPLQTFIIRKEAKGHGKKQLIEGPKLTPNMNIVLIDDVATTGKAFLHSPDVFEEMGLKAKKALCIVDRKEGGREALAARGVELQAIFDITEIHK